jgi:hypothetical protein
MKWRLVHTLANVTSIKDTNIDEKMARKYIVPSNNKALKRDPAILGNLTENQTVTRNAITS